MNKIAALVLLGSTAFAATGVFTFTGTATGTLNGTPFTSASFTVSAPGDFTTATCVAGICRLNVAAGAATFTIAGLGTGSFTGTTYLFDNQTANLTGPPAGLVGFGTTADLLQVYDDQIASTALSTYNLQSFIGPLGPEAVNPAAASAAFSGSGAGTSRGALIVPTITNLTFQVTAPVTTPSATPAPGSLLLLAIGLIVLATWKFGSRVLAR